MTSFKGKALGASLKFPSIVKLRLASKEPILPSYFCSSFLKFPSYVDAIVQVWLPMPKPEPEPVLISVYFPPLFSILLFRSSSEFASKVQSLPFSAVSFLVDKVGYRAG